MEVGYFEELKEALNAVFEPAVSKKGLTYRRGWCAATGPKSGDCRGAGKSGEGTAGQCSFDHRFSNCWKNIWMKRAGQGLYPEDPFLWFLSSVQVEHEYVRCDRTKVREILLNVVSNSIKYTPEGGSVSVRIQEEPCKKKAGFPTVLRLQIQASE